MLSASNYVNVRLEHKLGSAKPAGGLSSSPTLTEPTTQYDSNLPGLDGKAREVELCKLASFAISWSTGTQAEKPAGMTSEGQSTGRRF